MTRTELNKRAKEILESEVPRNRRNNMVLASTEDLSRIFDITLAQVQERYGHWDQYTLEVVEKTDTGYLLRFPGGQECKMLNPRGGE